MGVLPDPKGRFVPVGGGGGGGGRGQNALVHKSTNSVIMQQSYLVSRFKRHICRQPC